MAHLEKVVGTTRISSESGDLTAMTVDVVVNAANEHLAHGGGLARALSDAAGPRVQQESSAWVTDNGPLAPGRAAVTSAGDLPAAHLVHVAGPVYAHDHDNEALLRRAVSAALDASVGIGARSVALPAISAGIFGYPLTAATAVIASEAARWAAANPDALDHIRLVGYDDGAAAAFAAGLRDAAVGDAD